MHQKHGSSSKARATFRWSEVKHLCMSAAAAAYVAYDLEAQTPDYFCLRTLSMLSLPELKDSEREC